MPAALLRMTGELPGWYTTALKRFVPGAATVKVDWALDGPIPWANAEVAGAGTVHVGGSEEDFMRSVKQAHDGLAEHPFMLLGQQSVADPTRAPEGKHTAWAYTHGPQQGVDWVQATPTVVERMEEQVERFAPGFRDRILARHVLSPAGLEAPQPEPDRRRRRRRQLPAAPGRLPPGPEALALQHAAEGPVHRQRRDVPRRRGPRRARRRRRAGRAQGLSAPARLRPPGGVSPPGDHTLYAVASASASL